MTYADALTALDHLYATLPPLTCQRRCQESCGVIVMTRLEWVRLQRRLGYKPKGKPSCVCPMLKQGACAVQGIKPSICRLWGLVDAPMMRCPFGCTPAWWLSEEDGHAFLARIEELSSAVFPQTEATAFAQGLTTEQIAAFVAQYRRGTAP
jgi:hypothetical protein